MRNEGLIKNYTEEAVVSPYRIVKFGAADGAVLMAAAATDLAIGVSGRVTAAVIGGRTDIIRSGIAEVEYGGAITRGQELTADAVGRAVAAAPAAGVNNRIIGIAEVSGVLGDIGSCHVLPALKQG